MIMKKAVIGFFLVLFPFLLFGQETVEKIEIVGNDRVTKETILYYLTAREGDYYSEDVLKKDFRILWSTGFFSDIKIEKKEGTSGALVTIAVAENPVIRSVAYKTGKKVKEDDIITKLKENDEHLLPYSYYNPSRIEKIKKTIGELLAEKGLQSAKIETDVSRKGKNEVDLLFKIDEGPKMRVGAVVFEGSTKIPDSYLREAMKDNKPHGLISWIGGKDVYKQNKIAEDVALIKKKFQENGYMEAVVGEPRMEEFEKRTIFFRKQKMMRLVVPVNAGYLYRVGEIKIEGNKAIAAKYLQSLVKLESGDIYSTKTREDVIEKMGETYRNIGYLYSQIAPVESLDPKRKIVNVTFNVYEGDVTYLHRLEFRGNNYTKDKVIRREMLIREGDRFSLAYFKDSVLRIKQLGLVDLERDPDIIPDPDDPTQMDVTVNVTELQRNNIQFTAGYSGYEGTFVAFSYSTVNFLGAGENLEFQIQTGKRVKNYSFGFTEPYLFDQPITVGFNIHDRKIDYPYLYNQKSKGIDLSMGARILGYWRANVTYSLQNINVTQPSETYTDETGSPLYDYYQSGMYGFGKYNMSSIEPLLYRSTVDSPLTPTHGTLYSLSLKFAGSFLGGEVSLLRPRIEIARYQPMIANHTLGLHMEYQHVRPLNNSEIPFWEKFYLWGERSVRGYEIYTIGPRSAEGQVLGGEKSLVLNAEYTIPIGGPLYIIFFHDMGNAVATDQPIRLKDMYSSSGLEARVFVPALRVPFRLIFAYNNRKIYGSESNFAFRFAVGTTF